MKIFIWFQLFFLFFMSQGFARDFIVEFVEENYNEARDEFSNHPLIYHSIQVNSPAGPKLLILKGDQQHYRNWLRRYIAGNKTFIAKVDDNENDRFMASKAYEIDVTDIHPFNGDKWVYRAGKQDRSAVGLPENNYILVIDTNDRRSRLISSVIKKMGYTPMVSRNGDQALAALGNQPEKFKMIIANHKVPGMRSGLLLDSILKIDHMIPTLVETGYQNKAAREKFMSKFSGAGSVVLKSMVLQDLENTIKTLVKEKV